MRREFGGFALDEVVNQAVSEALGLDAVMAILDYKRPQPMPHLNKRSRTTLVDQDPIHIIFEEGLTRLNQQLALQAESGSDTVQDSFSVDSFRPNLVLAGMPIDEANRIKSFKLYGAPFTVIGPTERCGVIAIDQATGESSDVANLRSLGKLQSDGVVSRPHGSPERGAQFGVGALLDAGPDDPLFAVINQGTEVTDIEFHED